MELNNKNPMAGVAIGVVLWWGGGVLVVPVVCCGPVDPVLVLYVTV
jgi:hypothetical protein